MQDNNSSPRGSRSGGPVTRARSASQGRSRSRARDGGRASAAAVAEAGNASGSQSSAEVPPSSSRAHQQPQAVKRQLSNSSSSGAPSSAAAGAGAQQRHAKSSMDQAGATSPRSPPASSSSSSASGSTAERAGFNGSSSIPVTSSSSAPFSPEPSTGPGSPLLGSSDSSSSSKSRLHLDKHHFARLEEIEEHPEFFYLADNKAIRHGYRFGLSCRETILSLFKCHNETANVHSHLLGAVLFLFLLINLSIGGLVYVGTHGGIANIAAGREKEATLASRLALARDMVGCLPSAVPLGMVSFANPAQCALSNAGEAPLLEGGRHTAEMLRFTAGQHSWEGVASSASSSSKSSSISAAASEEEGAGAVAAGAAAGHGRQASAADVLLGGEGAGAAGAGAGAPLKPAPAPAGASPSTEQSQEAVGSSSTTTSSSTTGMGNRKPYTAYAVAIPRCSPLREALLYLEEDMHSQLQSLHRGVGKLETRLQKYSLWLQKALKRTKAAGKQVQKKAAAVTGEQLQHLQSSISSALDKVKHSLSLHRAAPPAAAPAPPTPAAASSAAASSSSSSSSSSSPHAWDAVLLQSAQALEAAVSVAKASLQTVAPALEEGREPTPSELEEDLLWQLAGLPEGRTSLHQKPVPQWPLAIFMVSAVICLGCSAAFHLFSVMSKDWFDLLARMDYSGIAVLIAGSSVPVLYYGFYCMPEWWLFYQTADVIVCGITLYLSLSPQFRVPSYRVVRAASFVACGAFGGIPFLHIFLGSTEQHMDVFIGLIVMGILYMTGAVMYGMRFPEVFYPGKFDFFSSHSIFHIFVLAACLTHYWTVLEHWQWRSAHSVCPLLD